MANAMLSAARLYRYPDWALAAFESRVAPELATLAAGSASEKRWIECCGPGNDAASRFRLFPGSLYLLWIEALTAPVSDDHARLAAALECLHNASLHHDDVLDSNDSRRGVATLRGRLGPSASLLAGDGLVGAAFRLVGALRELPVTALVAEFGAAWQRMTLGQLMDEPGTWHRIAPDRHEEHWRSMTRAKLALGNLAAPLAALSVGRDDLVDEVREMHETFAICSQIMNDLGEFEGWAGFHVIAPCARERAQEARQKPTIATIWGTALPQSERDVPPALRRHARREIEQLTSSALRDLEALRLEPPAADVLKDFFTRPLAEFERADRAGETC